MSTEKLSAIFTIFRPIAQKNCGESLLLLPCGKRIALDSGVWYTKNTLKEQVGCAMLKRAYVEITNRCNLSCRFCPGTKRLTRTMTTEQFCRILQRLQGRVSYLYLHVMGEPLLHPELAELLRIGGDKGFRLCLTTNGTLLPCRGEILLDSPAVHKVSISLHSMEGNGKTELADYLTGCWQFAEKAAERGILTALRLWNLGGEDKLNDKILSFLAQRLGADPLAIPCNRSGSRTLRQNLFLEQAERFDWPDLSAPERETAFCLGLRQQVAVLVDGTLVPCCLDHEGNIPLGHLPEESLEEILEGPRAKAFYDGFSCGRPSEELCRRCGYATRWGKR